MEEKYRKLAVELGIKREDGDNCCAMPSTRLTGLERENEEKTIEIRKKVLKGMCDDE